MTELPHAGVARGFREFAAIRSPDERMVSERRWGRAAATLSQSDVRGGGIQEVLAPDDKIDALTQIVDDHAEPVAPVTVPVAGGQVTVRGDLALTLPGEAVGPCLCPTAERDAHHGSGNTSFAACPGTARARPCAAVLAGPTCEGRSRAVTAVGETRGPEERQRGLVRDLSVGVGLADRPQISPKPEPLEILEKRGVVFRPASLPVVILDAQEYIRTAPPSERPCPDGVRDVTEMEIPGRGRCETRQPRRYIEAIRLAGVRRRHPRRRRPAGDAGRGIRARAWPRRAGDTGRSDRPAASGPRSPSTRAAGSRVRVLRHAQPSGRRRPWPVPPRARRGLARSTGRRSVDQARRSVAAIGEVRRSPMPCGGFAQPPGAPRSGSLARRAIDSSARWYPRAPCPTIDSRAMSCR